MALDMVRQTLRPPHIVGEVVGLAEFERTLRAVGRRAVAAAAHAIAVELEELITEAKGETPVDTGVLRASGFVAPVRVTYGSVEGTAGFGGAAAAYALRVHEDLHARHRVGKAHYLKDPWDRRVRGLDARLAERLARRI